MHSTVFFDAASIAGAVTPTANLSAEAGKRVGQERKNTAGNGLRRVVLTQPPSYRVGTKSLVSRIDPAVHGAIRALQVARFEREDQTLKYGGRATVRPR